MDDRVGDLAAVALAVVRFGLVGLGVGRAVGFLYVGFFVGAAALRATCFVGGIRARLEVARRLLSFPLVDLDPNFRLVGLFVGEACSLRREPPVAACTHAYKDELKHSMSVVVARILTCTPFATCKDNAVPVCERL